MTWYTPGTVTVTNGSAAVSGASTLWTDVGTLNGGDIFYGPDGKFYQIFSINSNTGITLATNYLGSSLSGQAYSIIPIGLLPSTLAQLVKSTLATANTALASTVRYDINSMGLTLTQQQNARTNIAALSALDVGQGRLSKSVAGGVDVTLTAAEASAQFIELTGTITANINVIVPAAARLFYIYNGTTGAFTVTIKTPSGSGIVAPQSYRSVLECDGGSVFSAITYLSMAALAVANGITAGPSIFTKAYNFGDTNYQFKCSTGSGVGGYIGNTLGSHLALEFGGFYNGSGNTIADGTAYAGIKISGGQIDFFTLGSLTNGSLYSPASRSAIDVSGNWLVGVSTFTVTPASGLTFAPTSASQLNIGHASGTSSGAGYMQFVYNSGLIGSITQSGTTAVLYNTTSDYRLKRNPRALTGSGDFIDACKPTTWEWSRDGQTDSGFLAHEFALVSPRSVNGVKDEMQEQEYEVTPAVQGTFDEFGNVLIEAVPAVMGIRMVPKYQSMQSSSSEVMANVIAELQSLRCRTAHLESSLVH